MLFFRDCAKIRLLMLLRDYTDSSDSAKSHPCLGPCEPRLLYWQQILNHWATREALQGIVHSSATFELKPLVSWLLSGMAMQSRGHLCRKPRPGGQPTFHGVTCLWTSVVDSNYFHFFLKHFHWSRVGLQCFVSFCCVAKWISYIDTYIHFF